MQTPELRKSDIFTASDYVASLTEAHRKWWESGRGPDARAEWLAYSEARKNVMNLIVKGLRAQ